MLKLFRICLDLLYQLLTTIEIALGKLKLAQLVLNRDYFRRAFCLVVVKENLDGFLEVFLASVVNRLVLGFIVL